MRILTVVAELQRVFFLMLRCFFRLNGNVTPSRLRSPGLPRRTRSWNGVGGGPRLVGS
jgi:hypothetical protein